VILCFKKDDNERDKVYTFESVDDSDTGRHSEEGSICVCSRMECGVENGGTYVETYSAPNTDVILDMAVTGTGLD
jgi:hypothetical protein